MGRVPQGMPEAPGEIGLDLGIVEQVAPVVEQQHIAVVEQAIAAPVPDPEVAVKRQEIVQIGRHHVVLDVAIQRLERPDQQQVRHPGRRQHPAVEDAGPRLVLVIHAPEGVDRRAQLHDVDANAGQLLPQRAAEMLQIVALHAALPADRQRAPREAARRIHRPFSAGLADGGRQGLSAIAPTGRGHPREGSRRQQVPP